jgi:hypothetical protein
MAIRVNINDRVLIRVRENGRRLFDAHYQTLHLDPEVYWKMAVQWDGRLRLHLWEVMHIFGPGCYMGPESPFDTEIEFAP